MTATVIAIEDVITVVEVSTQGPPGPPGPTGAEVQTITLPASTIMSGHRVIRSVSGKAAYVNPSSVADENLVLGISRNAAVMDDPVVVQTAGPMTDISWTWVPDLPIFCGPSGLLTQAVPTSGFILVVAVALTATQIIVGVKMPLALN